MNLRIVLTAIAAIFAIVVAFLFLNRPSLPPFDPSTGHLSLSVVPIESTIGSLFVFRANVSGGHPDKVELQIWCDGAIQKSVLYDDGRHGDGGAYDNFWLGRFDSRNMSAGTCHARARAYGHAGHRDSNIVNFTLIRSRCVKVHYSGDPSKKADVVFVGDGYADLTTFAQDVAIHANFLLTRQPFKAYQNRINIYRVHAREPLGCQIRGGIISCDDEAIGRLAAECPVDEIIVLVNTTRRAGSANPHAYASRLYPEITFHEFGHTFGPNMPNLADEYSYRMPAPEGAELPPNCDTAGCPRWSNYSGIDCISLDKYGFEGCWYEGWYRPKKYNPKTGVSIMEGAELPHRTDLTPQTPLVNVNHDQISIDYIRSILEAYE